MTRRAAAALLLLPLAYLAQAFWLRDAMGPYWVFHSIDPSYFYFFDALNLIAGDPPGHMAHPGIPLHWLGAIVVWVAHAGSGAAETIRTALADPEAVLRAIGATVFGLNAVALVFAGWAGLRAFGDPGPAMVLQAGPLLSSVVMRHGIYVKPESLLIFVAALLAGLMALALVARSRTRMAVAFGLLAGYGVALKLTAAPLFLAPVFLLWGVRPLIVYAVASAAALVLFALPAAGAWDQFLDYAGRIATHSGHFGEGSAGFLDWAAYPNQVKRMLARPVMFAPLLLAVVTVFVAVRRGQWRRPEIKALAGFALAQFCTALVVAKHPSTHYLVPNYVFAAFGIALLWRAIAGFEWGSTQARRRGRRATIAALAAILAAQGVSIARQHDELAAWRAAGDAVDSRAFTACARVHFQFANDPVYARMYGDFIAKGKRAEEVAAAVPAGDYWYDIVSHTFRDARGETDARAALAGARCVLFRGSDSTDPAAFLARVLPELRFDHDCSTAYERILIRGADCAGAPAAAPR